MRVALFFDGANFYRGLEATASSVELDYQQLAAWLVERVGGPHARLVAARYYTGLADQPGLDRFLSGLELRTGFFVARQPVGTREVSCPHCGQDFQQRTEKRVDTRIVADMIVLAQAGAYEQAVLLSGDDDLVPALDVVQDTGRPVHVATWGEYGLASGLRARAYSHIDLCECLPYADTGRSRGEELDDETILAQLAQAIRYFEERGGHLTRWYFVNRWSAGTEEPPTGPPRDRAIDRLVMAGRVQVFTAELRGRNVPAMRILDPRDAVP